MANNPQDDDAAFRRHLDTSGDREVVFCHECSRQWYRNEYGMPCPGCGGEFTEIVCFLSFFCCPAAYSNRYLQSPIRDLLLGQLLLLVFNDLLPLLALLPYDITIPGHQAATRIQMRRILKNMLPIQETRSYSRKQFVIHREDQEDDFAQTTQETHRTTIWRETFKIVCITSL